MVLRDTAMTVKNSERRMAERRIQTFLSRSKHERDIHISFILLCLLVTSATVVSRTGFESAQSQSSCGRPVLVAPLEITPYRNVYCVGDTLTAKFSIENKGDLSITLDVLTVGGRLNEACPPEGCPDFTFRFVTLQPTEEYQYEGELKLAHLGNYHFFVAYYIEDPTPEEKLLLDPNNWNTCIDLGHGLSDQDRTEAISVVEATGTLIRVKTVEYGDGSIKTLDLETEYLPTVVASENAGAPFESLKAQVVASRTFALYKIAYEPRSPDFDVYDNQSDQVYDPAIFTNLPGSKQDEIIKAIEETKDVILRWQGVTISSFFVSGTGGTTVYVTYNEGRTGDDIVQTIMGTCTDPPSKFPYNRGCMGQVQANALATSGYDYKQILRYFYGADIQGLRGDVNLDWIVNILDISIVAKAYGSKPSDPNWNASADLNKDGVIDILDIAMVAKDYGKTV